MSRRHVYLTFTVLGFLVAPTLVGVYIGEHGFDLGEILEAPFENAVAVAVFCDLTITGLVFWYWSFGEASRLGIRHWWVVVPAALIVGVCFAFPLFMYWREGALEGAGQTASP